MDLKHLRYFSLVAELGHVTRAADQLKVSQPFLTKIINQLEEELGLELFDHVGRTIQLNEFGKAYYVHAKNILRELEYAGSEVSEMSGKIKRTVSIITNVSLYLPGLLAKFCKSNPDIIIAQTSGGRSKIREALESGAADYALYTPPLEENENSCIKTELALTEGVCVIVGPNHPFRNRHAINITELDQQNYVTSPRGYGMRDSMDIYLRQKAVNPRVVIETTDTSLISSYVRGDLGFAFVPASVVSKSPELKRDCIKVTWGKMEGHVVVSWNDKLYKTSTHLLFREFIKDYFSSKYRV